MVLKPGIYHIVYSGEWKQTIEILLDDRVVGYLERIRTREGRYTQTRNMHGEVVEGACLEWLVRQTA